MMIRPRALQERATDDRGSALIIVLIATTLLTTLGVGLMLLSSTEGAIASNYRAGNETLYAADAAVERVIQDVLLVPRWNDILNGTVQSAFVDDTLTPTLPSGQQMNLTAITADLQAQSDATDPWGPDNPTWKLFAYGPLSAMTGTSSGIQSSAYIAVWVADDPSETDDNPLTDTNGVITVYAQAFGLYNTQRSIELTVAKTDSSEIERGLIAQRGQEELNQRARKAAVQLPGKTLTAMDLGVKTGGLNIR
jgi:PilX N-terminal